MTTTTEQLEALVAAVREGVAFFDYAALRIGPVSLRVVFHSMSKVRHDLVTALENEVVIDHPHGSGTAAPVFETTQQLYRELRGELHRARTTRLVSALIAHEATLLQGLREQCEMAVEDGPPRLAEILRVHLLRMRACHEELERLQKFCL
jgi:uncharacterized protein (TIGR02284 family)